jgi:hypothetical protein
VKNNVDKIYARIAARRMPPGGAWDAEKAEKLKWWIEDGYVE